MINLEKTAQNEVKSSKRLEILKRSLEKKQSEFDNKLNSHISDVKRSNGFIGRTTTNQPEQLSLIL